MLGVVMILLYKSVRARGSLVCQGLSLFTGQRVES